MVTIDPIYINSAIETLELVIHLCSLLKERQKMDELSTHLLQVKSKANVKAGSFLHRALNLDFPFSDQEDKPTEYWKGVRDTASYAIKQWEYLQDYQKFVSFLENTRSNLSVRISPREKGSSQLEEILTINDNEGEDDNSAMSIPSEEIANLPENITTEEQTPQESPSLPVKLLENEENDEILSSALNDALTILRDEETRED